MQAVIEELGSTTNFCRFYQTHAYLVRSIVRRYRFYDCLADDLVQDIFIKAWKGLNQLENHGSAGAWLRVIARNHCLNEIKSQRKSQRHLVSLETLAVDPSESISCSVFELSGLQLDEHLDFLSGLIENHKDGVRRQVARLFYVDHHSIREICERTQLKQNTVLSHLRRFRLIATRAMQRWIEEQS